MTWEMKEYCEISKCSRCDGEIAEEDFCIKMTESDPLRGTKVSWWCEKCYKDFKKDLED